jgi:hypothetical protein
VAKKKESWDAEQRRAEQTAARIAAYGAHTPREHAERDYPVGTIGVLTAAPPPADFEEQTADLVAALGLVGREVAVEGHARTGHLRVAPLDSPQGFVVAAPKHLRATYPALTIPCNQFARTEG